MKCLPLVYFLGFSLVLSVLKAEKVRIAVSDLLADTIESAIADFAEQNSMEFDFYKEGSLPAMERMTSDELDIAIIAIPDGYLRPDSERYSVIPLAYDLAVLTVNVDNPLGEISIPQLGGIFGKNETQDYKYWGDLGLSGWTGRSIKAMVVETKPSISSEIFKYTALGSKTFKSSINNTDTENADRVIANDVTCICLVSRAAKSSQVKTLMVSVDDDMPAYGPSVDNVHYGDYPFRLPFYVVFEKSNTERIKPILSYLLSENCSQVLDQDNFYALPDTVRSQLSFELNMTRSE
ncbi:MAG: Phosphate-binding protein PstS [Opitutia bacterium UBA7350]|nr:MAG: Phosphate-binding protein PstS [Opitutae bacterium UBA7350]